MRGILQILLCLVFTMVSLAESLDRIQFHGNRYFSNAELRGYLGVTAGEELDPILLAERVNALADSMFAHDYLFAEIDSHSIAQKGRRRILNVYLHEGTPARIREIRWLGDSLDFPREAVGRFRVIVGRQFHWRDLRSDIQMLLDLFEQSGYPFARVELLEFLPERDSTPAVRILMKVNTGPFARIQFVAFQGNTTTRSSFLERETRLQQNEPYDERRIRTARRRLNRLSFIRRVHSPRLLVNDQGKTGVEFRLEESRMSRIDVVIGYSPGDESENGSFSGLVDLELQNFFGGGRKARVHWERPNKDIQQIDLAYIEPWILNQPLSLQLDFRQRIEDTLYVTRHFGAVLNVELTPSLEVWGAARSEAVIVDSADAVQLRLAGSRTRYLETGFAFDTRDHPLNPRSGVFFSTFAGQGWRTVDETAQAATRGKFVQHRGGIDSEVALEIFPYWIAAISTHARAIESDEEEILLPDLYRLGGARSLRGYREEQFLGSRIGWGSAELRYWLGPASRFFGFVDVGGAFRERLEDDVKLRETIFKSAAGIGLRMETTLGVWGIDYGVGEGDNLLLGKLHVSLLSTF